MKEATARIKINRLLEESGWRFFDGEAGKANIQLEPNVKLRREQMDALGENFETAKDGFVDFLLLDDKGFPLVVLEAKSGDKHPLAGKEQARTYAHSLRCRFAILSNGDLHYFWDLERGNPSPITTFPRPDSVEGYRSARPDASRLAGEPVAADFVALTQLPDYAAQAGWLDLAQRLQFIRKNGLRFLRPYQLQAIHDLQTAVKDGKERFLFEMATGTGKTLTSAAVIKLFLRTGNARRVLFLVDRLELEEQAHKNFVKLLTPDAASVIYKENRDDWRKAEIVVTTVQSLLSNNKYRRLFSPTDFDLVISDEAHRSIGGNARAVFEHFVGYKLGLTATPRDYLKNVPPRQNVRDPREAERRQLLDTYRTFGCENSHPTFRYSLLQGVNDGYLVNPTVVDVRTEITTRLLSDKGFVVEASETETGTSEDVYRMRDFEKTFFSDSTNQLFCKAFLENGLRDPVSNEFGKSIVFAASQSHAAKLAQILNEMADQMYPGLYRSDFAVQVTSCVDGAQQYTLNFTNNKLMGSANVLPAYATSKARVCVTVGMMTTGYDCPDLLNLGLFRPVFSPTDFIQIKGRGTRKHDFREELRDEVLKASLPRPEKTSFKLFDFFANCEYFEETFDYDEVLRLPKTKGDPDPDARGGEGGSARPKPSEYDFQGTDSVLGVREEMVGAQGMRIDREFYADFEKAVRENDFIARSVEAGQWDRVIDYVNREIFDRPSQYYDLDKLRQAAAVDRRLTVREILEKVFGLIPRFKSKDELLEEEFAKFVANCQPEEAEAIPALRTYFKAYATSEPVRRIIEARDFADLATNASFTTQDYKAVPEKYRSLIPAYIRDYVPLDQFAA